jgi:hypothetical protein
MNMTNEEEVMKDVNDSPSLITIYMKDNTVRSIFNGDEKDIEMMVETVYNYFKKKRQPFKFNPVGEA